MTHPAKSDVVGCAISGIVEYLTLFSRPARSGALSPLQIVLTLPGAIR